MGTIYKITLESVSVKYSNNPGAFDINAFWEVEQTAGQNTNQYTVKVLHGDEVVSTQTTTDNSIDMLGIALDSKNLYELEVSGGDKSDRQILLLRTFKKPAADYDGQVLRITWSESDPAIGVSRCLVDYGSGTIYSTQIPNGVRGVEIPMSETVYGKNLRFTITLIPYANLISSGPPVELPALQCPSYTVQIQAEIAQIGYSGKTPGEEVLSAVLSGEIYRKDGDGRSLCPASPLEFGPLTLGNTAPYTLTVKTGETLTRETYDSFVAAVWPIVTARAMYALLDLIPRCALHAPADTLYFHCGLRGGEDVQTQTNRRCADLRPGFTLRLEQAQYLPQYQLKASDAAGFIGVHTAEYPITLTEGEKGEAYLVFDSFIAGMEEEMFSVSEEATHAVAGILDLSAVRMRSAFFRIQYPDTIYSSDAQPDIYEQNHTRLVAGPGWDTAEMETYLLFRGRSALTLLLTVWVNGVEKKLPVGTTWGGLLRSMGIWEGAGQSLKWCRRDLCGRWVLVTGPEQLLQNLPLMNGDRVEG